MTEEMVEYEGWGDDVVVQQAQEAAAASGGEIYKFQQGRNVLRFLPALKGQGSPFVVTSQHYINDPNGDRPLVFACPKEMEDMFCPVCERVAELNRSRHASDRAQARELSASRRVFANAINMDNPDIGPVIVAFGTMIWTDLLAIRQNPHGGGDFTHPVLGREIVIERTGEGKKTRYKTNASVQQTKLADMSWIGMQHDLGRFLDLPTDEDLRKAEMLVSGPVQVRPASGHTRRLTAAGAGAGVKTSTTRRAQATVVEHTGDDGDAF